ncbi:hypothetical protein DY000_02011214 [Brassica cretica]|uniref:Uncharacterized protein n=1 Tax=Brassica cretica TaxID=69181 RepID=A0ABQ7D755_BRACR|nr:hypothetical protein DY000_02011214 [Brassica cretica]
MVTPSSILRYLTNIVYTGVQLKEVMATRHPTFVNLTVTLGLLLCLSPILNSKPVESTMFLQQPLDGADIYLAISVNLPVAFGIHSSAPSISTSSSSNQRASGQ